MPEVETVKEWLDDIFDETRTTHTDVVNNDDFPSPEYFDEDILYETYEVYTTTIIDETTLLVEFTRGPDLYHVSVDEDEIVFELAEKPKEALDTDQTFSGEPTKQGIKQIMNDIRSLAG